MVEQYLFNTHDLEVIELLRICPGCAEEEERSRTHGEPWDIDAIEGYFRHKYGDGAEVRWLQGDEHRILVHVRLKRES